MKKAVGGQIPGSRVGQIGPPLSTAANLAAEYLVSENTVKRAWRNLSPDAFKLSLGRIYNRRKKAEGAPAGNNNAKKQLDQNDPVVSTAEQVAAETGVSSATVKRAGKFADEVAKAAYHIHRHQRTRSRRCQVARKPRGKGATFTIHRR